jgi:hypothetical protein
LFCIKLPSSFSNSKVLFFCRVRAFCAHFNCC